MNGKLSKAQQKAADFISANGGTIMTVWGADHYYMGYMMADRVPARTTTIDALIDKQVLLVDARSNGENFYYTLAPAYRQPADALTDTGSTEAAHDDAAAEVEAASADENAPALVSAESAPLAVGDRVTVVACEDATWAVDQVGTVQDNNNRLTINGAYWVKFDNDATPAWFMEYELRKLDTPDPLATAQAEIVRLQAKINNLEANTTMLTQRLADILSKYGKVYQWEQGIASNVEYALVTNREVANDMRRLLADADMCAPANLGDIEDDGFRWAIEAIREYRYLHNLG